MAVFGNSKGSVLKISFYRRPGTTHAYEGTYNESLSYDKNGNIKTLHRNGGFDMEGSLEEMDDLRYTYLGYSNKLIKVTDPTSNTQGFDNGNSGNQSDYDYDLNGNMISDKNKEILTIKYNHLNLPVWIEFPTGYITYRYNAAGIKVEKKVRENDEIITDYMDGFQYLNGELQFISHAEGYINFAQIPGLQEFNKFTYIYNYTDHLGNVRLSYAENPKNLGNIVILEENNYYPFGLQHAGYNKDVKEVDFSDYLELTNEELQNISEDELLSVVPVIKNKYKYKYQGQERQYELDLNWDSFKWRNYDYAIGRFMSVDPLSEKYSYQSHYNFSENRVVDARELEGLEKVLIKDINAENRTATVIIQKRGLLVTSGYGAVTNHSKITSSGVNSLFSKGNKEFYVSALPENGAEFNFVKSKNWRKGEAYKISVVYDVSIDKTSFKNARKLINEDSEINSLFRLGKGFGENNPARASMNGDRNFGELNPEYFGENPTGLLGQVGNVEYQTANEVMTHELGIHNMAGKDHEKDKNGNNIYPSNGLGSNVPGRIYPTTEDTQEILNMNSKRVSYE